MQANQDDWRSRAAAGLKSIAEAASSLSRFQLSIVSALLLLLVVGAVYSYVRSRPDIVRVLNKDGTPVENGSTTAKVRRAELTVHVAGAVNKPGLYKVNEGSRVADALTKAGGPLPDALLDYLNLAAKIKDGDKIQVPRQNQVAPSFDAASDGAAASTNSPGALININIAGIDELEQLPGVGPALARRIVEYRQKNNGFSSVEELDNVEGIGPAKLESIKDLVTI
jgi:competence protein ComEA